MNYENLNDIVNQLYAETEKLYKKLKQKAYSKPLDAEVALDELKKFSDEVGKATRDFFFNLCNSKNPETEETSFKKLQEVLTWVKDTINRLVKFKVLGVQEQGIIPEFPPKK
ncbi:MAG TPA: hypothetical protein VIQ31_22415 [Phormidium sp.]